MSGYDFVVTKPFDNPHSGVKQKVGDHITDQDAIAKILSGHHATYGVKVAAVGKLDPPKSEPDTPPVPEKGKDSGGQGQLQLADSDQAKK